jgi:hypothetical protein
MPVTARRGIQLFFSADGFIPSMRWRSVPEKTKRG